MGGIVLASLAPCLDTEAAISTRLPADPPWPTSTSLLSFLLNQVPFYEAHLQHHRFPTLRATCYGPSPAVLHPIGVVDFPGSARPEWICWRLARDLIS